jgi:D-glycero-D-manno-heptose 1,7-bisphosphate phosphatase
MLWPPATTFERLFEPLIYKYTPLTSTKTLLLDRDGVLNRVVMRGTEVSSPRSRDELVLFEDLSALAEPSIVDDWNLIIVSNQPDLSRGKIDLDLVEDINQSILGQIPLNASYICSHVASDECGCRKPKTGLIDRIKEDFPLAAGKMVLVGDRDTDRECAERADIDFILRRREYNAPCMAYVDHSVESLSDLSPLLRHFFSE